MQLTNRLLGVFSVAAALTLLGVASASAQKVELTDREFSLVMARLQTVTNGVPHRETAKTEELTDGKVVKTINIVREWDANQNRRVVTAVSENGVSSVSESIWIGSIEYRREGAGSWAKNDSPARFTGGLGSTPHDGAKYSVEEQNEAPILTRIYISEITYNLDSGKRIEITRYFTNKFHWRLKIERTESLEVTENILRKSLTTFDYDLGKIEIKAPIN